MEPIKQEIVNTIYENGEGLITGPVLQEVLLDMVNDVNSKDSALSSSIAETIADIPILDPDEYATTASVNELSESLNERIDNIITGSGVDLSGYLTTASYQIDSASFDERINSIPIPDLSEYATTESLNQVSESLAQEIADIDIPDISGLATTSSVEELSSSLNERIDNIPQVDLSGYATTESVNEATQSVKEWVEAKHYLTTASLSGSVTEETVGFMINDATASVKDWVEDQNYATTQSVTDLSSSIAETISEITGSDLSGYLTTASYLVDSASFDERIDSIDIPDVSIYATTESLNNLSESIAETYATEEFVSSSIADIQIPSIEGLATTESVNQLSESVAQTIADLPQVDLSGYATTSSVNTLVNETSESVKSWVEEQGYLTEHQDISGLATTSSVNELSESLNQRIDDIDVPDVSIYATTASVNELSESLNSVSSSFDQRISEITGSDLSGYLTTASYLVDSASFDQRIESIPQVDLSGYATTSSVNTLSQSIANTIDNLEIPDVSGLATTESVEEIQADVENLSGEIEGIRSDLDGVSENWDAVRQAFEDAGVLTYEQQEEETTYEVHAVTDTEFSEFSASVDSRINNITGSGVDLSGYATTASVNQLSSSIAQDFDNLDIPDVSGFATTSSVNDLSSSVGTISASLDQRINDINIPDVSIYATTASLNSLSESVANDFDNLDIPDISGLATTSSVNNLSESLHQDIANIPVVTDYVSTSSFNSFSESVSQSISNIDIPDVSGYLLTSSYQVDSASFDTRINNISGSDLSIYATTASVDSLAETVDQHTQDIQNLWDANIGYDDIQDITNLAIGYVPNYYCEITESVTLGFGGYPEDGQIISINVHNLGASASLVNIPDTLDGYTCIVNGVEDSGSCSIPAGEYGDIVVTRANDVLYFRTSIDVSNISVDLSGYATTASLQDYVPNSATSSLMNTTLEETLDRIGNLGCEPDNPIMLSFYNGGCDGVLDPRPYYYHPDEEYPYIYDSTEPWDEGDEFLGWVDEGRVNVSDAATRSNEIWCNADNPDPEIRFTRFLIDIEADGNPTSPVYHTRLKIEGDWDEELQETLPRTATFNYQYDYPVEGFPVELEVWNENEDVINYFQIPESINDGEKGIIYNGTLLTSSLTFEIDPRTAKFFTLREWGDNIYIDTLSGYVTTANINQLGVWIRGEGFGSAILSISKSIASGTASLAHGRHTTASGDYSHAEGFWTIASGDYSHAEGELTTASGYISHAEGYDTIASGQHSHAEGEYTIASGNYSHAEGVNTIALGRCSHAEGRYTIASNIHEHAQGMFNATASNQIFSIGCGNSGVTRKNAITVITGSGEVSSASIYLYGIGGYDGTNPISGSNDIATVIADLQNQIQQLSASLAALA